MKRYTPNQKKSARQFTKHALDTNYRNLAPAPMRGGYRL